MTQDDAPANIGAQPSSGIIISTAGSILATTAAQFWVSRSSQLDSGSVSWILLLFLIKFLRPSIQDPGNQDLLLPQSVKTGRFSSWIFAVAIASSSLCASENNAPGTLLPALIPVLLSIERRLNPVLKGEQSGRWASLTSTTSGSVLISLFAICSLTEWDLPSLLSLVLSILEFLALLVVFGSLIPRRTGEPRTTPFVDIESCIASLTPQVVAVLALARVSQGVLLGFVSYDYGTMILASIAKALAWFFVIKTARKLSWTAIAIIETFALFATRSPFIQSFEIQALSHILGSGLLLSQLIELIPKRVPYRGVLWIFLLVPILPYVANLLAIQTATSRAAVFASTHQHPVELIMNQAKADFDSLLMNQSQSYTAACDEYRRRFNFDPPPGFEEWFEYATSHASKIIDDFDTMYTSIAPLWKLSGQEINQAMIDLQPSLENEIWRCKFSGRTGRTDCVHNWRSFDRHVSTLFNQLLGNVTGVLPDVEFLVNHLDGPRVIFPGKQPPSEGESSVEVKDLSQTPAWDSLVKFCPKSEDTKRLPPTKPAINTFGLPFIQNLTSSKDLCQHSSYRNMHSLLMNPTSFRIIERKVPVLSPGSLSTMNDVLFPSPAYIEDEFVYDNKHDPDWSWKKNNLYWAGSTSGAFAGDRQWKNYHRHRFVTLVQMLEEKGYTYLAENGGIVQRLASSFLNSRLFDVAFTRIFQCARKICHEQWFFYRTKAWVDKDKALRSRLVFDLDGNGISGRWYKMVASKSAPLKQTILREWHDDRLLPWVHFIPVSLSMEELPELVMYLTTTKQGQQKAKEIADQGREWTSQALREVDMSVYLYRLLLELSRLQDMNRPGLEA